MRLPINMAWLRTHLIYLIKDDFTCLQSVHFCVTKFKLFHLISNAATVTCN